MKHLPQNKMLAQSLWQTCFWLVLIVPFIAPFDPAHNTDAQGIILLGIGAAGWLAVICNRSIWPRNRWLWGLIAVFGVCLIVSMATSPHKEYSLLGPPYIRLGVGGLIACIGAGLAMQKAAHKQFLAVVFGIICFLATISIPFSWWHYHTLIRIGGVVNQPDILAVLLGVGVLSGIYLYQKYQPQRWAIGPGLVLLVSLMLLTETRAVILLMVGLLLVIGVRHLPIAKRRQAIFMMAGGLLILVILSIWAPRRLTDWHYGTQSVSYRYDLQRAALKASFKKPLFGYGPGNVADALDCRQLTAVSLQQTCVEGYFFNSSHNIFLDRILEIGWIGGLSYIGLVVYAIAKGYRSSNEADRYMVYAVILIAGYYLTNVTSIPLELLFWILLIRSIAPATSASKSKRFTHA